MTATNPQAKARENRLRRKAARRGYQLFKSRRRDPGALDYDQWVLVENKAGTRAGGGRHRAQLVAASIFAEGAGSTLDDIERELDNLAKASRRRRMYEGIA